MASPFEDAVKQMNLTPQEQNLYRHHLDNLHGTGKVQNPAGSTSSMLQAVVPGPGGKYYNIPTVWGGQALDVYSSAQLAAQQGWHNWPSYPTPETADLRYETMHDFMERDTERYQQATEPLGRQRPLGSFKHGGPVKKTGVYKVHKGEKVVPARAAKAPAKRAAPAKGQTKMRSRTRRPAVPRVTTRTRRRRPLSPRLPVAAAGPALGPPGAGPGLPPGGPPGMPPGGGGGMPMMKKGGKVKRTGPHMLHKGEHVVPAKKAKKKPR